MPFTFSPKMVTIWGKNEIDNARHFAHFFLVEEGVFFKYEPNEKDFDG